MRILGKKMLYKGNWISLNEITYRGKNEERFKWESVERTNFVNTVVMVARLVPSGRYILIKQYRPVIDNYVIGFPAGLMEDANIEKNALRELKEETGYTGEVKSISPMLYSNAALLSDTVRLVNVDIDEKLTENINPEQELEETEDIEVILVEKDSISDFVMEQQKKGLAIGLGCWYVFCGLKRD